MNRAPLALLVSLLPACTIHGWDDEHHGDWSGADRPTDPAYAAIDPCDGAPTVQFPAAVCVCDSLTMVGNFEAYGFGGTSTATVGVNGRAVFASNAEIQGTLYAQTGLEAAGNGEVSGDIISTGSISWMGNLEVGGDVNVGGDLEGLGNLEVEGDLRLGGDDRSWGNLEFGGYAPYVAPAEAPCPCDPSTFFDVTSAVVAAADEPAIANLSTALEGNVELSLDTGAYYVRDASWLGNLELIIDGHVDLFIEDSLTTLGNGEIELTRGSTLDVYVAGSLQTVGNTWIGGGVPGAVRIYVGGDDGVQLHTGNLEFIASVYAPSAHVDYLGNTEILGAIFARTLSVEGNFEIAYPGLLDPPEPQRCPPSTPGDDGDEPGPTTGAGDDDGPERETETGAETGGDDPDTGGGDDPGPTTGDDPGTTGDDPGTTGDGDETTGGEPPCPEVADDCYDVEEKFACMETPGCMWKHGSEYCTWQTCGGLDETMCGLDQVCAWNECKQACYPG